MSLRNSLVRFMGAARIVTGTVATAGVVLSNQSGNALDAAQVTSAATATGVRTLTIKNFKGPKGRAVAIITCGTISVFASVTDKSYSGNTLTVVVKLEDDASTATNAPFDYLILAY